MLTHDGYYRQRDGLAMEYPLAPPLANGWLYLCDEKIGDNAKLYARNMLMKYPEAFYVNLLRPKWMISTTSILHFSITIETKIEGALPGPSIP